MSTIANFRTSEVVEIKIKYLADIDPIRAFDIGDWFDLRSAVDMKISAGEYRLIPLGVAMELPEGYEALVVPRSSTYKNFGIIQANSVGVIDNSYCGNKDEWHFPAIALRDTEIHRNDRICQFRIIRNQPSVNFVVYYDLPNENRGGIGSTGVK